MAFVFVAVSTVIAALITQAPPTSVPATSPEAPSSAPATAPSPPQPATAPVEVPASQPATAPAPAPAPPTSAPDTMPATPAIDPALLTVAESSNFTATGSSAQVQDLIARIHERSSVTRLAELGKTSEGKPIPLIILANPPVTTAKEARETGKAIAFVMANIHAGEVEGKEASLMLAREIGLDANHPLLRDLIIVIAPNYNADGNDRFDTVDKNRPGQDGPAMVGVRPNAQNFDLNRDYMKVEAPETQALLRFLNEWDPDITIDLHTTNGSQHRYTLSYEAPLNPSGHPGPIDFVRSELLRTVQQRVRDSTGYETWHYGNFNREHTVWETYSSRPMFGGQYQGLRNQMSVLSEAYSYAPYKDRVMCTRAFVLETLKFAAENRQRVRDINAQARQETAAKGANPQPDDIVGIRHRPAAFPEPVLVKGYEKAQGGEGGAVVTDHSQLGPPKDYLCVHVGRFEPTLGVRRPFAYIIPPGLEAIVAKLQQHGIVVEPFAGKATVEVYTVRSVHRQEREFQGHHEARIEADATLQPKEFPAGSFVVRTAQPLGTLAVYLLEPESDDGLTTWNFFDAHVEVGKEFPIVRVRTAEDLK